VMGGTRSGRNVRPAGEDVGAGDVVVPAGLELTPGELALLAALGLSPVRVIRRPRVAILVTGDELVESDADPGRGQIRDSNSVALRALVQDAGGEVVSARVVPDDRTETVRIFRSASEDADLLVSSGGVSVGRYDYVRDVVEELGQIDLWRVAMQPGKPVVLGEAAGTPFLGLPGNPVSVHVCFEQFVRPALRKMRGCRLLLPPLVKATLTEGLSKRPGRLHFVRVRLAFDDKSATWMATPTGLQGSHIQSSLVDCNGVARFEREETQLKAGDSVSVELWSLPHSEQ
jgi:molybdopterin molybdotransferase